MSVDIVLHYRYGTEVRQAHITNVSRAEADRLMNSIGSLRSSDGIISISGMNGVQGVIPARGIEMAEIKERS